MEASEFVAGAMRQAVLSHVLAFLAGSSAYHSATVLPLASESPCLFFVVGDDCSLRLLPSERIGVHFDRSSITGDEA